MRYGEASALIRELGTEVGSHYQAARDGWAYPQSLADIVVTSHAEAYLNAHRDEKKQPTPILLPRPWDTEAEVEKVTQEELDTALERLTRHSAFRDS